MAKEIERKYLLSHLPDDLVITRTQEIDQTYLASTDHESLRVRRLLSNGAESFTMTHKAGRGIARDETEFQIGRELYEQLTERLHVIPLRKTRHKVQMDGHSYDLDIYHNTVQQGLITIEIEFESEDEYYAYQAPAWFGEDVTEQGQYVNSQLWHDIQQQAQRG
ncbi:CYTH domain-containing protein [Paenibacillus sp. SGZ-1009]|uniref:CYTH domain-containing protein n=1 Tax=Paenibacillus campi TaxID=3106031 RepID=UPI002AFEA0AD|nr:CYTH domain-containing protein [Paenibacillus sp. SGZ-1009]